LRVLMGDLQEAEWGQGSGDRGRAGGGVGGAGGDGGGVGGGAAARRGSAVANGGGAGTVKDGVGPAAAVAIGNPRSGARAGHPDHSPGSLSTPSASDHSGGSFGPHGQVLREKLGG